MKSVVSGNIESAGYDESAGEQHVKFKNNPLVYVYPGVAKETHEEMLASPSVGAYFDSHVKKVVDKDLVRKFEPEPPEEETQ